MSERIVRLFVSSPGDVTAERQRVDHVIGLLNGQFAGRVTFQTIRWEAHYYSAHETFQAQITEAADCDLVVAIFRARLGSPLPEGFPPRLQGEVYPSGTAYEVLSAIESRKTRGDLPDVYVFRYPSSPSIPLDSPDRAESEQQWHRLKAFFDTWFYTKRGEFLAGFQDYTSTDDFAQKLEDCLRQWLNRNGILPKRAVWDRVLQGSPFPGLAAFDESREAVFFGRDLAVMQAIQRLRQASEGGTPFLLLIGASGAGKSSLLRAGLLPRLVTPGTIPDVDLWRRAIVTPGADPFLSLAEALMAADALGAELRDGTFRTKELLAKQLRGDVDTAVAPIRDALSRAAEVRRAEAAFDVPRPARLALVIDQGERLFVESSASDTATFADLLAALVRHGIAIVILALRSDAYGRFQAVPSLVAMRQTGADFDLLPPSPAELEEIVTQPVEACVPDLAFEQKNGQSLAALLVADTKGGDALPLLQMTLSRLYAQEAGRGDGVLRFDDYRGMAAAVTETAQEALETLPKEAREQLPALVTGLVRDVVADPVSGALVPLVARLDRTAFEAGKPDRKALLDAFVAARLLTSDGDALSERVRPVHEALLRIWPEAQAIIGETAALLQVRHTLEPIVRAWAAAADSAKASHLDISPALLDGARQAVVRLGDDLPAPMLAFVAASQAADAVRRGEERQTQERRIRDAEAMAALSRRVARRTFIGLAAALVLAMLAGWQGFVVQKQRDRAQKSLSIATETANGLVFGLAEKFRDVIGVPSTMIREILDRARQSQEQLIQSGESSADLRLSQATALIFTSDTMLALGETENALTAARQARDILQALSAERPENTNLQYNISATLIKIGDVLVAQNHIPEALKTFRDGLPIAERLSKVNPSNEQRQQNLSNYYERIGFVKVKQGNLSEALENFRDSLAIRTRLASASNNTDGQRELSVSLEKIGDVLAEQGQLLQALKNFRDGLAIRTRLSALDPGNAGLQRDLSVSQSKIGDVLMAQGNLPEALENFRDAVAIAERLSKNDNANVDHQHDLSVFLSKVGSILVIQGNLPEALKSFNDDLAIIDRLAKTDPSNADWQSDLATENQYIGDVHLTQGDMTGASKNFGDGLRIMERLNEADHENTTWQRGLTVFYERIGDVLKAQGHLPEALKSFRDALAIADRLAKNDADNASWQLDLSVACDKVGSALAALGDLSEALKYFREQLAITNRLVKADPSNLDWQRSLSVAYERVGDVFLEQGNMTESLKSFQDGLAVLDRSTATDTGGVEWQRGLSIFRQRIGDVLEAQRHLPESLKNFREGFDITNRLAASDPKNNYWQHDLSIYYNKLGDNIAAQGDLQEALKNFRGGFAIIARLSAANPINAEWQRDLSVSYNKVGDILTQQGEFLQAKDSIITARAIIVKLLNTLPNNREWIKDLQRLDQRLAALNH